jgi:flagellar assembly factor FliW
MTSTITPPRKAPAPMTNVTLTSTRFGTVEVPEDAVVEFPSGLIGLGGARYALIAAGREDTAFMWLQSVEDPELALPVTRPNLFFPDYVVEISDAETAELELPDGAEPEVWVTVRATDEVMGFSANLRAPILLFEGRGRQVINEAPDSPVRAPLFTQQAAETAAA